MSTIDSITDVSLTSLPNGLNKPTDSSVKEANIRDSSTVNKLVQSDRNQTAMSINDKVKEEIKEENKSPLSQEQLEKVAQQLQDFVGEMNHGLEFTVDKDSGRDVIKVIDRSSGDLVKQYPSEEVLTLVAKLSDMVGGFVDAKV